jgi:cytochrome o ubiquinol oxidase subunit I
MTMIIAVPTGVKIFNWLFTMYRGRIRFTTPMLWFLGFVGTFTLGGAAGVMLAVPPIDFQVHNSLFLVAHFHTMIVGGVLFGYFAALTYWFPKIFGFKLNERLGRYAFWCWLVGFLMAFVPLYILGLMGATRRIDHYDASLGWQQLFIVAAGGVALIGVGVFFQLLQVVVSIRQREQNRDLTGDPWKARTLEWATSSPAPVYNFALLPEVTSRDAFWTMKHSRDKTEEPVYESILMPRNTPLAIVIAGFSFLAGFGLIWHIYWLALIGLLGVISTVIYRSTDENTEYRISASAVRKIEQARTV